MVAAYKRSGSPSFIPDACSFLLHVFDTIHTFKKKFDNLIPVIIFAPAYLPVGKFFSHRLSRKAEGNGPMKP